MSAMRARTSEVSTLILATVTTPRFTGLGFRSCWRWCWLLLSLTRQCNLTNPTGQQVINFDRVVLTHRPPPFGYRLTGLVERLLATGRSEEHTSELQSRGH